MRIKATAFFLLIASAAFAADEIIVNASAKISSGTVIQSQLSGDVKLDMTNAVPLYVGGVVQISSASTQALADTAVNAPGFLWVKNTSTNFTITAGPTNAAGILIPAIELRPEEIGLLPRGSAALYFTGSNVTNASLQWFLITR